jgi:hypothetical protein
MWCMAGASKFQEFLVGSLDGAGWGFFLRVPSVGRAEEGLDWVVCVVFLL